jgi:hypothetical protein
MLAALIFTAGCAAAPVAHSSGRAYVLERVELHGLPPTELAQAREGWRADSSERVVARDDGAVLAGKLASDLRRDLRIVDAAPLRLRVHVTLESPGSFQGLAPETADLAATAEIVDTSGTVVRTVSVRETANAPLQRSASRRERLDAALARLSRSLARQL